MTATIAAHEWKVLTRSPFAWIAAGMLQLVFSWLYLTAIDQFIEVQGSMAQATQSIGLSSYIVVHYLAPAGIVFLLATPLLCMHLIAGEVQSGRYALLASSPISSTQITMGKFLGALLFQYAVLALNLLLVAVLLVTVKLDIAYLLTAFSGLALYVAAATALSLFCSSLTNKPALSAFISFATLLLLWLAASAGTSDGAVNSLSAISPASHVNNFMRGLLSTSDVVFFLVFAAVFITLCIWRLESMRSSRAFAS